MTTLITLLALAGATLIVVRGTIFRRVRALAPSLLGCAQCTGVWIGALAGGSGVLSVNHGRVLDAVIVGAATSLLSVFADAVLLRLLGEPEGSGT